MVIALPIYFAKKDIFLHKFSILHFAFPNVVPKKKKFPQKKKKKIMFLFFYIVKKNNFQETLFFYSLGGFNP